MSSDARGRRALVAIGPAVRTVRRSRTVAAVAALALLPATAPGRRRGLRAER